MLVEPEPLPDLSTLSDDDLQSRIRDLEQEEDSISFRRKIFHGRIDLLRAEYVAACASTVNDAEAPPRAGAARALRSTKARVSFPRSTSSSRCPTWRRSTTATLRTMIHELEREEDDVSLRRRFLQGQIDILRAARYERLRSGTLDVSDLARVLTRRGKPETGEPE